MLTPPPFLYSIGHFPENRFPGKNQKVEHDLCPLSELYKTILLAHLSHLSLLFVLSYCIKSITPGVPPALYIPLPFSTLCLPPPPPPPPLSISTYLILVFALCYLIPLPPTPPLPPHSPPPPSFSLSLFLYLILISCLILLYRIHDSFYPHHLLHPPISSFSPSLSLYPSNTHTHTETFPLLNPCVRFFLPP